MKSSLKPIFTDWPDNSPLDDEAVRRRFIGPNTLNRVLIETGAVTPSNMFRAVVIQQNNHTRLEHILLSHGWVTPDALLNAQSLYAGSVIIDPEVTPPDPLLIDAAGIQFCLSRSILPWKHMDGQTWIAISQYGCDSQTLDKLEQIFGSVYLVLCSEDAIQRTLLKLQKTSLVNDAENCVPAKYSCRDRSRTIFSWPVCLTLAILAAAACWWTPYAVLSVVLILVFTGLLLQTLLKLVCLVTTIRINRLRKLRPSHPPSPPLPLPIISIMVPLYKESDIARHLVSRLSRLKYPRELTDVILLLEADDHVTQLAVALADLPEWFRVIEVPEGSIKTKPRALNYGLNFCKGDIIGIWDAEDKPLPDQLHQIAQHFHNASPKVGCVQGVLDYYNPRTNWLSRCFTIEYAAWFRVLLPAMERLGLIIPLGGTTCFFRREALEDICGWDAWNVTEDADAGVRLARYGWTIETVATCTDEEANCRLIPWMKQRSRWQKGYIMTWAVHMRRPRVLRQELGTWRFLCFHVQFLTMIGQFLFAPIIIGFWVISIGLSYSPFNVMQDIFGTASMPTIFALLVMAEALNMAVGIYAVSGKKHRHLRKWVATTLFYYPLGYIAFWKAAYEIFARPFYWDKTAHGIFSDTNGEEDVHDNLVQIPLVRSFHNQDRAK